MYESQKLLTFGDVGHVQSTTGKWDKSIKWDTSPKRPLNLLEIHEIGSVDTFESKQNYDQIWHLLPPYQKLLGLSHFCWLSHSPVWHCTSPED